MERSEIQSAVSFVSDKLNGRDYKEVSFQNLLLYALQKRLFNCNSEVNITYNIVDEDQKICVGFGRVDIICRKELTYILELKVGSQKYIDTWRQQIKRYVYHYDEPCVGVLIIFDGYGKSYVEFS